MVGISERISNAVTTVRCPGCGQRVVPIRKKAPQASAEPVPPASDERWSFIWRPPSGLVCPECLFPLERLARRMKWVHTASIGSVLLILGVLVTFVRLMGSEGAWMATVATALVWVGGVALFVGVAGVVVGGRRGSSTTP